MNLFFREGPCLALCRLGRARNRAGGWPGDGRGNPHRLGMMAFGVSLGAWLVAVGDAMDGKAVKPRAWVPLLLQGSVNRGRGLVVARIGRIAQPHIVESLVDSTVDALTS